MAYLRLQGALVERKTDVLYTDWPFLYLYN